MSKRRKEVLRSLEAFAVMVAMIIAGYILIDGMYLMGIPKADRVDHVLVAYPTVSEEVKEISDEELIRQAVQLSGFLKYSLFETADEQAEPLMSMTYVLTDGDELTVSVNRSTVWWKGKAYALKEPEMFINLAEGIFFSEELREQEAK